MNLTVCQWIRTFSSLYFPSLIRRSSFHIKIWSDEAIWLVGLKLKETGQWTQQVDVSVSFSLLADFWLAVTNTTHSIKMLILMFGPAQLRAEPSLQNKHSDRYFMFELCSGPGPQTVRVLTEPSTRDITKQTTFSRTNVFLLEKKNVKSEILKTTFVKWQFVFYALVTTFIFEPRPPLRFCFSTVFSMNRTLN